jgi:hypothetical protein
VRKKHWALVEEGSYWEQVDKESLDSDPIERLKTELGFQN